MTLTKVHTCKFEHIHERLAPADLVKASVGDMPAIPAGASPFLHDSFSMGTDLVRGWTAMHEGFDKNNGLPGLYLVNTTSGQRIRIAFEPVEPRWTEDVYADGLESGATLYCWVREGDLVDWYNYPEFLKNIMTEKRWLLEQPSPVYVVIDKWLVQVDVVADGHRFARWVEINEPDLSNSGDAVREALRFVESGKTVPV